MSRARSAAPSRAGRATIWLVVGAGLLLVLGANTHLVYVALTSQPACVVHLEPGADGARRAAFSAAQSACSPPRPQRGAPSSP